MKPNRGAHAEADLPAASGRASLSFWLAPVRRGQGCVEKGNHPGNNFDHFDPAKHLSAKLTFS